MACASDAHARWCGAAAVSQPHFEVLVIVLEILVAIFFIGHAVTANSRAPVAVAGIPLQGRGG